VPELKDGSCFKSLWCLISCWPFRQCQSCCLGQWGIALCWVLALFVSRYWLAWSFQFLKEQIEPWHFLLNSKDPWFFDLILSLLCLRMPKDLGLMIIKMVVGCLNYESRFMLKDTLFSVFRTVLWISFRLKSPVAVERETNCWFWFKVTFEFKRTG